MGFYLDNDLTYLGEINHKQMCVIPVNPGSLNLHIHTMMGCQSIIGTPPLFTQQFWGIPKKFALRYPLERYNLRIRVKHLTEKQNTTPNLYYLY